MTLSFEPLDVAYLEWARLLHNDPDVLSVLTDPHEVSEQEQVVWFKSLQDSWSSQRMVAFLGTEAVGVVRVDQIDFHNKSVCVGLDIHKDFRGQKLAKPIYKKIFEQWFVEREFNRVWLMVAGYNFRAINLYKGLGFRDEGVQREALFKNGNFYDYLMMSLLRREYNVNTAL